MPYATPRFISDAKPIPMGRLVSASGRKSTPYRETTPTRPFTPRRNGRSQIIAFGAVGTLIVLAIVGIFLARTFHDDAPSGATPLPPAAEKVGQNPNDAVASSERKPEAPPSPYAAELVVVPMPRQSPEAQSPTPVHLEMLAVAPRDAVREAEVALIAPPKADPRPALPQDSESLKTDEAPVKPRTPVADAKPPLSAVKELSPIPEVRPSGPRPAAIALKKPSKDAETQCAQFGTKIDFLPMPSIAYENAKKDTSKLVMVLHIAGNFEEKGFT